MKPKTILFLAVVLVLAIAYIVLRNTDLFKPREEPVAGSKMLLDQPKGAKGLGVLAHVEIVARGGGTIVLDRVGPDKWRLAGPPAAGADALKVQDLRESIKNLQYVQSLEPGDADASDQLTSLDKPLWTVTVGDQAGATRKLLIGKNPPLSPAQTYVRVEGDKHVYVVGADLGPMLSKTSADLRDKNVLVVKPDEIQKVDIEGNEQYTLSRVKGVGGGEDTWAISRSGAASGILADGPKVRDLLRRFDPLTALDFVADAPASLDVYGLDKPRLIVTVWTGIGTGGAADVPSARQGVRTDASAPSAAGDLDGNRNHGRDAHATHGQDARATGEQATSAPAMKVVGLAIGSGTADKVYAKLTDQPAVFQIEASLVGLLGPKIAELRDKQVLHFDVPQVAGIIIQSPQGRTELTRKGGQAVGRALPDNPAQGQWDVAVSDNPSTGSGDDPARPYLTFVGKANQAAVAAALDALKHLEAQSFEGQALPERYGLDKPQARITLLLDNNTQATLLVGKASASGEMTFVQVEHGAGVVVVKSADIKPLLEAPGVMLGCDYMDKTGRGEDFAIDLVAA